MSTPNRMQAHWNEVRKFIKAEWPRFSDATLRNINGDFDKFLVHLKDIYNNFPAEEALARRKIQTYINTLEQI